MLSNNYFVCLPEHQGPVSLDPFSYRPADYPKFIEIDYLTGSLRAVEQHSCIKGLTFYITWSVHDLPSYGDDVVVILMGDEWCRFPRYLGRVRAVFRSHHNWPMYTGNLANGVTYGNIIAGVQFLRLHIKGLPGRLGYFSQLKTNHESTTTYVIPLGYANQLPLPILPITNRPTDLIFMGSMNNVLPDKRSLKYWLRSPKTAAREEMLHAAREYATNRPDVNVYLQGTEQFAGNVLDNGPSTEDEKVRYSNRLMGAKICLVPRGSSLETFRLFEAVRYGCIAICERLPNRWYYEGLPAVQIDRWNELERIVDGLLSDPERLERLHQDALNYWRTRCSEEVLGRFISERLTAADGAAPYGSDWQKGSVH